MLLLTWNTFWWSDEAISMKFFVSEHLWRPFWPGNIDLRVPIYQQKMFGGPRSIIMSEKQKKFLRAAILDFMKNAPFDLKHLLVKRRGNFDEMFCFRAPVAAILTRKYWSEGANISIKNVWETKIYHYEWKTEKKFHGGHFGFYKKCSFWPETPFGEETKQFWWNFWFPSTYGSHFDQNIVLRVPIYNNIDEIIDLWAPMAAFVSNSKHHLACKHFDQHIPHIY